MWYHRSTSFRVSRLAALVSTIVSITLGFSPIVAAVEPAAAVEPISASSAASYPRLMAWWPDVHTLSAAQIARYDAVILYDWAAPQAASIKAADPTAEVFVSTSASELTMYTDVAPESWKNAKLSAASARWCVTQPGSTLVTGIDAAATTLSVVTVDTNRFRVGDVLAIDEEFLEVQAVNAGSPGSLVVRRGAVVSGARHAATAHAAGARVAAVVREYPNTVLMDLTDRCPLVDVGNGPEDFNTYLARVSASLLGNSVWDGIYFDMIESDKTWVLYAGYARNFDLDRSNVVPANTDAFNAAWASGVRRLESQLRARVGDAPIITNGAEGNWDLINGTTLERFPKKTTTTAEWKSSVFGTQYPYTGSTYFAALSGIQPNYSNVMTYDQDVDPSAPLDAATYVPDYKKMRFGLTTALLGNGLFAYDLSTDMRGNVPQLQWFDEYDNAGAGAGYLGTPLSDATQVTSALNSPDLLNGDGAFTTSTQLGAWTLNSGDAAYSGTKSLDSGAARVDVTAAQGTAWKLALTHPVSVAAGTPYTLSFRVRADRPSDVQVFAQISDSPYTMPLNYGWVAADTAWRTYELQVTSTATLAPSLRFALGSATGTVWFDDVKLQAGARSEVWRRDFENGISLVNATATPVTVDLGGTFRKIDGTQDRTVNDGSVVTSVTLPAMDGIILLREAAPAPEPTPEPTPVPVPNVAPTAAITATPGTGTAPVAVSFSSAGSSDSDGTIASYRWEFGDGTTQTGSSATHTYAAAGTYTARLTVTDDDGATASATRQIVVSAPAPAPEPTPEPTPVPVPNVAPTAAITATPGTGTAPVVVSFSSADSSDSDGTIASYRWEFGDGTNQTGPSATHTYAAAGTYTATLTVTDDDGATASASKQIVVSAPVTNGSKSDVHRFLNKKNGTHFLTASTEERDAVVTSLSSVYAYEGVAYSEDPARNTQPLYRFYNRSNGTHFYTASKAEADSIVANLSHIYTLDGQAYNVCATPVADSIPVFRFYNVKNGAHFYTASTQERDETIANLSSTYLYEGPAFWLAQ